MNLRCHRVNPAPQAGQFNNTPIVFLKKKEPHNE
jgi:hypothetical protein